MVMNSSKEEKTSYSQATLIFPILCVCLLCIFLLASCARPEGLEKVDVAGRQTPSDVETETGQTVGSEQDPQEEAPDQQEQAEPQEVQEDPDDPDPQTETADNEKDQEDQTTQEAEPMTIKVYYADAQVEHLVGEERMISATHKYLSAFMELSKPPLQPGHIKLMPEGTRVNRISFSEGNIELDLSREFVDERFVSNVVDLLLVFSIVNTMTEFEEVNTVTFFIDGERLELLGQLDISSPQFRDESWIKD